MEKNYRAFLPYISNNFDFAELLSEMLGELNVSHTGSGYIYHPPTGDSSAQLGVFFNDDYRGAGVKIAEIINDGPLDIPGKTIKPGTLITKINGVELGSNPTQLLELLNRKAGKSVRLTLKYQGRSEDVTVKPISWRSQSNILYKRWVEKNRKEVEKLSNGTLGYVHIRGMDPESFQATFSDIMGKYNEKDGIVIDTRFNGGGWLHNQLSILFTGESYSTYAYRGKSYFGGDPDNRWTKKSILLVSEGNYSDAHFFAYTYRALKIGKIVGMPVAGTSTAVWWPDMLDHTMYFGIPQIGIKDQHGHWLENQELVPDIVVENKPGDVATGKDAQLETAVQELMK
jgi:C-terminal processing protease CtpA/Prc